MAARTCVIIGNGNAIVNTDTWYKAHEIAAASSPIPIYNATIGGKLDIYPRITL